MLWNAADNGFRVGLVGVDKSRSLEAPTDTKTRGAREIPRYVAESPLAKLAST
jgi:hypothetical protein